MNIIQKILTTLLISAVVSVPILGSVCNTEVKATEKDIPKPSITDRR